MNFRNISPRRAALISAAVTLPTTALAQSAAMPWENPICQIANSFSGPVAVGLVVLAVVFCGAMLAFGELNGIFKSLLGVAMGASMAVGAVQWVIQFAGASRLGCIQASVDPSTLYSAFNFLVNLV